MEELSKWNCIIESVDGIGAVYLGDIDCAQNEFLLKSLQIGAVLSILDEPEIKVPKGVANYIIPIGDCPQQNIIDLLPQCIQILDQWRCQTNIMVHCYAGISRSASIVIGYLMNKLEWNYEKAVNTVISLRRQVRPNYAIGFEYQLKQYEQILALQKINKQFLQSKNQYYY